MDALYFARRPIAVLTVICLLQLLTGDVTSARDSLGSDRSIEISVAPDKPIDLPPLTGRSHHTLTEASVFAWQQFIAHTWPAKPQTGEIGSRGEPDRSRRYGEKGATGQVVWETYRHKAEVFPGQGEPNGMRVRISATMRCPNTFTPMVRLNQPRAKPQVRLRLTTWMKLMKSYYVI